MKKRISLDMRIQTAYIGNMSPFTVYSEIEKKLLEEHDVEVEEAREAFYSVSEMDIVDETRARHLGWDRIVWFISETFEGRILKVVLAIKNDGYALVSAYEPSQEDLESYEKLRKERTSR